MTDRPSQLALRQWRDHMSKGSTLVSLAGTALVLSLAAPFGMEGSLGLFGRLGYWMLTVFGSYAIGSMVFTSLSVAGLTKRGMAIFCGLGAGVTAALVTGLVVAANIFWLGVNPMGAGPEYIGMIFVVALIISLMIAYVSFRANEAAPSVPVAPALPKLMDRLPVDKRGALVALSGEDHYVRVRTRLGEELVLMRLSDAIDEAAPTEGIRVHRSHWVALEQVRRVTREGERAVIEVEGGAEIPVSRGQMKAVREAGLLTGAGRV